MNLDLLQVLLIIYLVTALSNLGLAVLQYTSRPDKRNIYTIYFWTAISVGVTSSLILEPATFALAILSVTCMYIAQSILGLTFTRILDGPIKLTSIYLIYGVSLLLGLTLKLLGFGFLVYASLLTVGAGLIFPLLATQTLIKTKKK